MRGVFGRSYVDSGADTPSAWAGAMVGPLLAVGSRRLVDDVGDCWDHDQVTDHYQEIGSTGHFPVGSPDLQTILSSTTTTTTTTTCCLFRQQYYTWVVYTRTYQFDCMFVQEVLLNSHFSDCN